MLHVIAWSGVIAVGKSGQDLHMDSTEAYAWGLQLLAGYGKHPPMVGWVARLWFSVFPTADWAMYALAMAVMGAAIWASWLLALHVVDRRRAMLVVLALMIYPIFSFKGYKYNPDTLLAPLFVIGVLVFVIAFETKKAIWGFGLGIICAGAVLTKYWGAFVISGVGLAAILHPNRAEFFRSPAPYAAAAAFIVAMLPHAIWLVRSDYAPFEYASIYLHQPGRSSATTAAAALGHHALLLLPVVLAIGWAIGRQKMRHAIAQTGVRIETARLIWVVIAVFAVLPPALAVILDVHMKSDWGIPLYGLVPLALMTVPQIRVGHRAVARLATVWLFVIVAAIASAELSISIKAKANPLHRLSGLDVDLAMRVTQLWRERFGTRLPVVAGPVDQAADISFYSPDHPTLFSDMNPRIATWIDIDAIKRSGFIAICPSTSGQCIDDALAVSHGAEPVQITQSLYLSGQGEAVRRWTAFVSAPAE